MAQCLCRSLPLASSSSTLFHASASLRCRASVSLVVAPGKCTGAKTIAAQNNAATPEEGIGNGFDGVIKASSRRRILSLGLLATTGLAAGLAAPPESSAAEGAKCIEFTVAPSGLAFCDTQIGAGIEATKGMLIKAHYTGKLENGTVFDSSYKRGKPLTFRVGVGEVIRGWDQGLSGAEGVPAMLAGGKRTLRIPSNLAYGERGAGCRGESCLIPPNSTLIFDVEFVGKA